MAKVRLELLDLESRLAPTVAYSPAFGAEHVTLDPTNEAKPTLTDPPVFFFFFGKEWAAPPGSSQAASDDDLRLESAFRGLFTRTGQGPSFVQSLGEYTGNYVGGNPRFFTDAQDYQRPFFATDLNADNTINLIVDDEIGKFLDNNHIPTSAQDLYVLLTPPGRGIDGSPSWEGFHALHDRGLFHTDRNYAWIRTDMLPGGGVDIDATTTRLSHVLAEAIVSPTAGSSMADFYGHTYVAPGATWSGARLHDYQGAGNQIADFEAEEYTYRVNGTTVQSYWSAAAGAFVVPDGNRQTAYVDTQYDASHNKVGATVTLRGDGADDHFLVSARVDGGVDVTMNGETFRFDASQRIKKVSILPGAGHNALRVAGLSAGVTVDYTAGTADAVTLGLPFDATGSLTEAIAGDVNIHGNNVTNVQIDDTADQNDRTAVIGRNTVTGLFQGKLTFDGLSGLGIQGGYGDDVFTIDGPSAALSLVTGSGLTHVGVRRSVAPVVLNGRGFATVTIGATDRNLDGVQSTIDVGHVAGTDGDTQLIVDDSMNAAPRDLRQTAQNITWGRAGAAIRFDTSISYLTISGGTGGNRIHVAGLATAYTSLFSGGGRDDVTITSTGKALTVDGEGGQDAILVAPDGVTTLDAVTGLSLENAGGRTALTVDNSLDVSSRSIWIGIENPIKKRPPGPGLDFSIGGQVERAGLRGLTPHDITWTAGCIASLTVQGGTGQNVYVIEGTVGAHGLLDDPVATAAEITIRTRGSDVVNLGAAAGLSDFRAPVHVLGPANGNDVLSVNDSAAAGDHNYVAAGNTVLRSGAAAITYANLSSLRVAVGTGSNQIKIAGPLASATRFFSAGTLKPLIVGASANPVYLDGNRLADSSRLTLSGLTAAVFGQPIPLSASMTTPKGYVVLGGTITFKEGSRTLAVVPYAGPGVVVTFSNLSVGAHVITAIYSGNGIVTGSQTTWTVKVGQAYTRTVLGALTVGTGTARYTTLTATVTAGFNGRPTGFVRFRVGGVVLGYARVGVNGRAALRVLASKVTRKLVTVEYLGAASFHVSTGTLVMR